MSTRSLVLLGILLTACGASAPSVVPASAPPALPPPAPTEMCADVEVDAMLIDELEVMEVTPAEIAAFATAHPDLIDAAIAREPWRFENLPEQRRISHVLFVLAPDAPTRVVTAARRRAEGVLRRARAGQDFAALASAESADAQSAGQGGDLGWSARGDHLAEIDAAVFGATEVGVLPSLVRTELGLHVIDVTGVRAARDHASVEEARETIAPYVERRERRIGFLLAHFARASAREPGTSLADALRTRGGDVVSDHHGPFRADERPAALSPDLQEASDDLLARASALRVGEILGPTVDDSFVRALERLADVPCAPRFVVRTPPDTDDPIADVESQVGSTAHGLAWAYSDCYRLHALESETRYGTIGLEVSVGGDGTEVRVRADGLENDALSACVSDSFFMMRRLLRTEGDSWIIPLEIGFDPPS